MPYTEQQQQHLLRIARDSIYSGLEHGKATIIDTTSIPDALKEQRATFVTLHKQAQLRGCIGTIMATAPLAQHTAENAYAAAFRDHRFLPLEILEFDQLQISISVLSPPKPLTFNDEAELLEKIRPGIDGLILEQQYHRGVFLPSVWESLTDKKVFLNQLKRKAGLPLDYWSNEIRVNYFNTEYFSENEYQSNEYK
jgi:AmmeMemoRadiSam system protein A